ncbi:hypothetical protein [Nevskia sp.]|uniref:hypothetical protein n=1 Tax=Nevskia sp. TaxID=1929292 RepID=UPI0025FB1B20|nr:hypothetical protein [Nevskia sp.]
MGVDLAALHGHLAAWLDDGDAAGLDAACAMAKREPVDVDALLSFVADYGASRDATDLALRRLRFAIGLPVVAGPVCRRPTGD